MTSDSNTFYSQHAARIITCECLAGFLDNKAADLRGWGDLEETCDEYEPNKQVQSIISAEVVWSSSVVD